MPRLPRNPRFWLCCFLLWLAVLWFLSSFSVVGEVAPPIPHFDKVEHFGYFFGGSGLLCAYLYWRKSERPNWRKLIAITIAVLGIVGALDEWHQSFTPGRRGNDPYDLVADLLGAVTGAFVFKRFHRLLK